MTSVSDRSIYERIGARPVINAGGNTTIWGGSTPSPSVMRAMEEAGNSFVEMEELLETSGAHIADLLDVEAAYVTAGCYAALVLSVVETVAGIPQPLAIVSPERLLLRKELGQPIREIARDRQPITGVPLNKWQ